MSASLGSAEVDNDMLKARDDSHSPKRDIQTAGFRSVLLGCEIESFMETCRQIVQLSLPTQQKLRRHI
jgi:hypothetical protein